MEVSLKTQDEMNVNEAKQQLSRIHRLGGVASPKKIVVKSLSNQSQYQDSKISFSQSNPFFYVHKAMHSQFQRKEQSKRNFIQIVSEIHQMKLMCQKQLQNQAEDNINNQKTLIMDLQNLQTRRINLDQEDFNQDLKSYQSIKDHIQPKQSNIGPCFHDKCDEVNEILTKALHRLEALTQKQTTLQKELQGQQNLNLKAKHENESLRTKIAQCDKTKCQEIEALKHQIYLLKKKTPDQSIIMINVGRTPLENLMNNQLKMNVIEKEPTHMLNDQKSIKNQITCRKSSQNQSEQVQGKRKLHNVIYL